MNQFDSGALRRTDFRQPEGFLNPPIADKHEAPHDLEPLDAEEIVFETDAELSQLIGALQNINPDLIGENGSEKILGIANLLKKEWFSEYATNHDLGLNTAYDLVLSQAEKLVRYLSESDIVELAKSGNVHRTVLARVIDKWSMEEGKILSPEFKKLVRAMVELGYIVYEVDKKLQSGLEENIAKFTGVLKKAELFLKEINTDQVLRMIKEGGLHPSVFKYLLKAYEDRQMIADEQLMKSAREIIDRQRVYEQYFEIEEDLMSLGNKKPSDSLVERNRQDYTKLNELLNLYTRGERKDPGHCKQKIQDIIALEIMKGIN